MNTGSEVLTLETVSNRLEVLRFISETTVKNLSQIIRTLCGDSDPSEPEADIKKVENKKYGVLNSMFDSVKSVEGNLNISNVLITTLMEKLGFMDRPLDVPYMQGKYPITERSMSDEKN